MRSPVEWVNRPWHTVVLEKGMRRIPGRVQRLVVALALMSAAALVGPTFARAHAAGEAGVRVPALHDVTNLNLGSPLVIQDLSTLSVVRPDGVSKPAKPADDGDGDNDNDRCGVDHDSDHDNDCKEAPESEPDNDNDQEDQEEAGGSTTTTTTTARSTSTTASEDVCENAGFSGATIADQLVDAGLPLNEPEANGPISSALVKGFATTPLAPLANELACLVNLLTL